MALVFSTGSYGIIFARTFFGPNFTHPDYHLLMKRIITKTWKFFEDYLFFNRVKVKSVQNLYFRLIKEYISDFKA
jgi:hypothetical protein